MRKAIHFNEAMQVMDIARELRQTVDLKVWELQTGNVIEYRGWLVSGSSLLGDPGIAAVEEGTGSVADRLNHFTPYENHADDSAFHFVG